MNSFSRATDALGFRLCLLGLLFTSHFVYGLVATTKSTPKPFTESSTLPPLDIIPTTADWESSDYSSRLPIVYTNDIASAEEWVQTHLMNDSSEPQILGWDMESTPYLPWLEHLTIDRSYFGPATLQLSTSKSALVLQVSQDGVGPIHEGGLPRFLHTVLENPNIIPVGVGIDDDLVELYRWCLEHGDDCAGPAWGSKSGPVAMRFDIGGIGSDKVGSTKGLARLVAGLVAGVLGVVLPKSKKLARTHWSREPPLAKREVAYAARDAWAAAAILDKLQTIDPERFDPSTIQKQLQEQTNDKDKPLRT
eukprot:CAMPEP_0116153986 /NCGR_PEP_ID=MMETSP0329-20121206/21540_1 /TAXON_ID=697910 /ORGANISM="Pseudo-nitzschia arenysensis, Strain B593" /LENGTH=306 /DNA_ID=CAMNT_0003650937 /DNA_START=36 /DNA_END=953 /DNA_ORIENTATION=-